MENKSSVLPGWDWVWLYYVQNCFSLAIIEALRIVYDWKFESEILYAIEPSMVYATLDSQWAHHKNWNQSKEAKKKKNFSPVPNTN